MKKFPYGRTALITGGSSGIGLATARLMAQNGYRVWALSRHADGAPEQLGDGALIPLRGDVRDEETLRRAVDSVLQTDGELGTVVLCAGFGISGAVEDTPLHAVREQFDTNYFGVLRTLSLTLPALRARGGGMVAVVGSVAGRIGIPFQSQYSASKFALEAVVETLRVESRKFGIRACIVEPGDTKTGFTSARDWTLPEGSPYEKACMQAIKRMEYDERHGDSPDKSARAIVRLIKRKRPPVRRTVGWSYKLILCLRRLLPDWAIEFVIARLY